MSQETKMKHDFELIFHKVSVGLGMLIDTSRNCIFYETIFFGYANKTFLFNKEDIK